jgi:hypothetical protein
MSYLVSKVKSAWNWLTYEIPEDKLRKIRVMNASLQHKTQKRSPIRLSESIKRSKLVVQSNGSLKRVPKFSSHTRKKNSVRLSQNHK